MKILFLLFSFLVNLGIYFTPFLLVYLAWKKLKSSKLVLVDLNNKYDRLLTFTPFLSWAILYLFDPNQKTVRQVLFPDPFIIGSTIVVLLLMNHHNPEKKRSSSTQWIYISLANLVAVTSWFAINPLD